MACLGEPSTSYGGGSVAEDFGIFLLLMLILITPVAIVGYYNYEKDRTGHEALLIYQDSAVEAFAYPVKRPFWKIQARSEGLKEIYIEGRKAKPLSADDRFIYVEVPGI